MRRRRRSPYVAKRLLAVLLRSVLEPLAIRWALRLVDSNTRTTTPRPSRSSAAGRASGEDDHARVLVFRLQSAQLAEKRDQLRHLVEVRRVRGDTPNRRCSSCRAGRTASAVFSVSGRQWQTRAVARSRVRPCPDVRLAIDAVVVSPRVGAALLLRACATARPRGTRRQAGISSADMSRKTHTHTQSGSASATSPWMRHGVSDPDPLELAEMEKQPGRAVGAFATLILAQQPQLFNTSDVLNDAGCTWTSHIVGARSLVFTWSNLPPHEAERSSKRCDSSMIDGHPLFAPRRIAGHFTRRHNDVHAFIVSSDHFRRRVLIGLEVRRVGLHSSNHCCTSVLFTITSVVLFAAFGFGERRARARCTDHRLAHPHLICEHPRTRRPPVASRWRRFEQRGIPFARCRSSCASDCFW